MRRNNELRFSRRRIDEIKKKTTNKKTISYQREIPSHAIKQASMQTQSHSYIRKSAINSASFDGK